MNISQIIKKVLKENLNYLPSNYSYSKISKCELFIKESLGIASNNFRTCNLTEEQVEYIINKISKWCVWAYTNAEPLNLHDEYCEKMLLKITNTMFGIFLTSVSKYRNEIEISDILDSVAQETFCNVLDNYLAKGFITKEQNCIAKYNKAANESERNIAENVSTAKSIKLILLVSFFAFVVTPIIISLCLRVNVFEALAISLIIAFICYVIYMLWFNWSINKNLKELWILKGGTSGAGNVSASGKGTSNKQSVHQITISNDSKSQTQHEVMQSKIEICIGKALASYAEGYFDGQLPVLIARLRNKLKRERNYLLRPVAMVVQDHLSPNEYVIKFQKRAVASGYINFNNSKYEFPMEELTDNLEVTIIKHLKELQ